MVEIYDIVIRNGRIIDGTGNPWLVNDIAIKNGRISKVGRVREKGEVEIDAKGLVISPGFIDIHNHSDLTIMAYPYAESYILQGVTTVVVGNCGLSMAPLNPANIELLKRYLSPFLVRNFDYKWNWRTLGEFYRKVEEIGVAINLVPLVGHGTIRLAVKGFDATPPSKEETEEMKELLKKSLEEGAFGFSKGLIYPPGAYASTEEIIELAKVVRDFGGIYATHIRNEGKYLIEAVEEAIKIGEETGIPIEISHHKASGKSNWGKVSATLRLMMMARKKGVEINCDVYPYTAGSTTITALLPTWVLEGGVNKMLERLKDKEMRKKIKDEIEEDKIRGENFLKAAGWDGILISQ
jgi:N-acyl-D-aspartate/D-glutamate deacylase